VEAIAIIMWLIFPLSIAINVTGYLGWMLIFFWVVITSAISHVNGQSSAISNFVEKHIYRRLGLSYSFNLSLRNQFPFKPLRRRIHKVGFFYFIQFFTCWLALGINELKLWMFVAWAISSYLADAITAKN